MRKFKHKITGNVAENRGDIYYFPHPWGGSYLPKEFIENTEDWEEVVEKGYEILEYKTERGFSFKSPFLECSHNFYRDKIHKIHSVKRLFDGEIFTVGDRFTCGGAIDSLDIIGDEVYIGICKFPLNDIKKVKQKEVLFTTEDGVEIFEGDKYYQITFDFNYIKCTAFDKNNFDKSLIIFSTKEKAEEYIKQNKPIYSLKDVENTMTGDWFKTIEGSIVKDVILTFLAANKN